MGLDDENWLEPQYHCRYRPGSGFILGVYFVYHGEISVGTLIFAFTLSEKAYASIYRLSRFYDRMEEGRRS